MSSGKEKKLILNHLNKMFASTKWKVKYGYMNEIRGVPERVYEILFNGRQITYAIADDVDVVNPSTHLKREVLSYKLSNHNLVRVACRLKRKKK